MICSYSILQSNKRGRPQSGMVPTNRPTDTLSVSLFHSADIPKNLTANKFNNHFLSVAEFLAKPRSDVVYHSDCSNILHEFCERKIPGQEPFVIPYISIPELAKHISKMDNKRSSGPGGISNHLLKLSLPYIIDSLTYIFITALHNRLTYLHF